MNEHTGGKRSDVSDPVERLGLDRGESPTGHTREHASSHFVTVVEDDDDRFAVTAPVAARGVERGERVVYLTRGPRAAVLDALRAETDGVDAAVESGTLVVETTGDADCPSASRRADAALDALDRTTADGAADAGLRVVTEMTAVYGDDPDAERVADYERALADRCRDTGALALCQYDRRAVPPELLRDAVRTHPYLVADGTVCRPLGHGWDEGRPDSPRTAHEAEQSSDEGRDAAEANASLRGAYRELRRAEQRLRFALEAADLGVWEIDLESETSPVRSPRHDRIFGYDESVGDWTFERYLDHVHPDDRERVERSFEADKESGGWSLEFRIVRADGRERWIASDGEFQYDGDGEPVRALGTVRDVTDRKRLERALQTEREHFRMALENSPFTAFRLDTDLRYTWVGNPHPDFDPESVLGKRDDELLPPEAAEKVMAPKRRVLETGEGVREEVTYDLPSGEVTYDLTVEPLRDESGTVTGLTSAALDVTERKALERTLTRLHEASRDLVGATSYAEASERTVDAASAALGVDGVAIYLFDSGDNTLKPTAATETVEAYVEELPTLESTEPSIAWNVFLSGETAKYDDIREVEEAYRTDTPVQSGGWVPLGDHGVLAILSEDENGVTDQNLEVADHLAATAEATLDRVDREASIREQRHALAGQNRRLEALNRVSDIVRAIDQVLVEATTAEEIQQEVCDRLTDDDHFACAWVGQVADGAVAPQTVAGGGEAYLDELSLTLDADATEPALAAASAGEVSLVSNVVENVRREPWRKRALAHGFQSGIGVPIRYEGIQYGVLTVYATESDAFDGLTRDVLEELGQTVANAMNAAQSRQALLSASVVELELSIRGANTALSRLAGETGGRFAVSGTVPLQDGRTRVFVAARDCSPAAFERAAADSTGVESVTRLDDGETTGGGEFELVVSGETVAATLASNGAVARTVRIADDEASVRAELSRSADVRAVVDRLESTYPQVELVARRDAERGSGLRDDWDPVLTTALTDRQREVLQTAYLSGYFEWPRDRTGEEVADSLGITQSTFNKHLRHSERKLFGRLFDPAPSTGSSE